MFPAVVTLKPASARCIGIIEFSHKPAGLFSPFFCRFVSAILERQIGDSAEKRARALIAARGATWNDRARVLQQIPSVSARSRGSRPLLS